MSIDSKLDEIAKLRENWDGYNAPSISVKALDVARKLEFCPCSDGSLDIELYSGGVELGIHVDPDGIVDNVTVDWKRD